MDTEGRRKKMIEILLASKAPVTGTALAKELGVSRQVIVQDIALLRAGGVDIMATPQGYLMLRPSACAKVRKTFACLHDQTKLEEELLAIVDCGGTVVDVIVEHPLYGDLRGSLNLKSRYDVQLFRERLAESRAQPLSILTGGVHLHTVEADNDQIMAAIEQKLKEVGVLLE
ncbi:transcription repressor NadR [Zhaonella formicivorans]|jgi:hypothetical protein|uniref:transcription repressor NadR n=1 Tax=Zhaonella formicivorans TaxID=2528593 RepID=UPI0010CEDBAF|nr:transcription repressor NadR [Zhaonella formicivorans]